MPDTPAAERVAVIGAGAVGCYFGGMLARAGADVTLVGRPLHMDAIAADGLLIDGVSVHERVRVATSTSLDATAGADIVLFCVKTLDTAETARTIAPLLQRGAIVVSMQNGVDNVERMRAHGIDAVAAAVYVAAMMSAPGVVRHTGRGDLVIGRTSGSRLGTHDLQRVATTFNRADVRCDISSDIAPALWTKLVINCAYNAISALTRSNYRAMNDDPEIRATMRDVVVEAVAVANAAGVPLQAEPIMHAVLQLGETMAGAVSSTAQDIARGKRTEIDSLNGFVARRAADLGVAAPLNRVLHTLVHRLEEAIHEH